MAQSAPRPCLHPGCRALTKDGRCEVHAQQLARRIDEARRARRGNRKYDRRAWRDGVRPQQLRLEPLCRHCKARGWLVQATEVDHIDGNADNDEPSNLQSLCKACHSRKTAAEQGGFGRG